MKVLELLDEIEDIVDTASGIFLTGKIMIDSNELLEIVKEIRSELPEEIQQARWIKNERDRILTEAKNEYETIIKNAEKQAEELIDTNEIMTKAKNRAEELMTVTESNIRQLKMSTYDYVDGILFDFQEKMDELSTTYFNDMFSKLEVTFNEVNGTLASNREEIKEMAYKTSMNLDETTGVASASIGEDQEQPKEDIEDEDYEEQDFNGYGESEEVEKAVEDITEDEY